MQNTKLAAIALVGALAFAGISRADDFDKKTILTVNETIMVPGKTLPPGKYVMKLLNVTANRHVVQIFNEDQTELQTTILAIPNYRVRVKSGTTLTYWETPAGTPRALRAWFYPGDNFGQEFAYPKQKAVAIAAFVKTPVPTIVVETKEAEELKTVPLLAVTEAGETTQIVAALPVRAPEVAQREAPASVAVETVTPAAEPMPHTASMIPLLGLAGLVSLSLFALLGFASSRRRTSKV